jgi:hypothetical protein
LRSLGFDILTCVVRGRRNRMVKALCYKPKGRGFDMILSLYLILQPHQALGVTQPLTEMSTRHRYKEFFCLVERGMYVALDKYSANSKSTVQTV